MLRYPVAFDDPDVIPLAQMVEALNRLDRMQELPTPVIAAMVSDREIVRRIRKAKDDDEVQNLVEVEAAAYAKRLETTLARVEQDGKALSERVDQLAQTSEEHRKRSKIATDLAARVTSERDEAVAALERARRESDERAATAKRDAEMAADVKLQSAVEGAVRTTEVRLRADFSRVMRRTVCGAVWGALVVMAAVVVWLVPDARTPLGGLLTIGWVALATYALAVIAQRGRSGDTLSKSADVSGIISLLVLILQTYGFMRGVGTSDRPARDTTRMITPQMDSPAVAPATDPQHDSIARDTGTGPTGAALVGQRGEGVQSAIDRSTRRSSGLRPKPSAKR
jgi:hypothetical protein